jgi:CheY-like chemotaxis protein
MPGMDGLALIDILGPLLGPVPMLLMSGYAEEAVISRANSHTGVEFIPKPVTPNDLIAKVQEMLTAHRRST